MKMMFKNINGTKKRKYDMNMHKTMIIPDGSFQTNNKWVGYYRSIILLEVMCKLVTVIINC